jgi:hypothetical protein
VVLTNNFKEILGLCTTTEGGHAHAANIKALLTSHSVDHFDSVPTILSFSIKFQDIS